MPSAEREAKRKISVPWRLRADCQEFSFDTVGINALGEVGKVVQLPNLIYVQLTPGSVAEPGFCLNLTIKCELVFEKCLT